MRFALFSLVLALLAAVAMSVAPLQPVIISFPKEAPNDLLESAKKAVLDAKGKITHEYSKSPGFALCVKREWSALGQLARQCAGHHEDRRG